MERRFMDRPLPPPSPHLLNIPACFPSVANPFYLNNSESDKDVIYFATDKRFGLIAVGQTVGPLTVNAHFDAGCVIS